MAEILIPLEPGRYYHIFNHAIGKENFFECDTDYTWFLEKFKKYIIPVSDVLAFCLMPNHFHFVVKIKSEEEIRNVLKEKLNARVNIDNLIKQKEGYLEEAISRQYSHLFNSYAKYFNYVHHRKGTLFTRAFRRKLVEDHDYLKQLICYVHQNPVEAGYSKEPSGWKFTSYNAIISLRNTLVCRNDVIELFDDVANFVFCNGRKVDLEKE